MKRFIPLALIVPLAVAGCSSSKSSTATNATTTVPSASSSTAGSGGSTGGSSGSADMKLGNPTSAVTLTEAGSSLLYPYLQLLVDPLHSMYSNVTLQPAAGGSGKGISDAIAGTTTMGGSDAYLSSSQLSSNPGLLNVPIAVSSQAVNYNLPGVTNLKLSGDVLAKMYQGSIKTWNDPAIKALNPGANLPSTAVVPVRRVDSSGDTFLFTSYLSAANQAWSNGPSMGTTVSWPSVSNEVTAQGNPGMVQTCGTTPGCVAYIGISAESTAQKAGLGEAMLQNKSGSFLQPNPSTVQAAVTAGASNVPDNLAASLIYEDGTNSYPIVNFEYIVVKSKQSSADTAQAVRDFLDFAISPTGGASSTYLDKEQFQALPANVLAKVQTAISSIQ
ncbi:MAG TPA: phosphate ABC transporter substrate-binding protein PstS [Acidimicrobiales bacterium]|nr:phosphate ABC transporter substrate-binding protein PstS [Acidimicrobiales bacterium]